MWTLSCHLSQDDTNSNMVIEAIKNDKLHQMERDLWEKWHITQTHKPHRLCSITKHLWLSPLLHQNTTHCIRVQYCFFVFSNIWILYHSFLNLSPVFSLFTVHRKVLTEKYIMTAAKLIAPAIETSFATGFDWFVTDVFVFHPNILTPEGIQCAATDKHQVSSWNLDIFTYKIKQKLQSSSHAPGVLVKFR